MRVKIYQNRSKEENDLFKELLKEAEQKNLLFTAEEARKFKWIPSNGRVKRIKLPDSGGPTQGDQ